METQTYTSASSGFSGLGTRISGYTSVSESAARKELHLPVLFQRDPAVAIELDFILPIVIL